MMSQLAELVTVYRSGGAFIQMRGEKITGWQLTRDSGRKLLRILETQQATNGMALKGNAWFSFVKATLLATYYKREGRMVVTANHTSEIMIKNYQRGHEEIVQPDMNRTIYRKDIQRITYILQRLHDAQKQNGSTIIDR